MDQQSKARETKRGLYRDEVNGPGGPIDPGSGDQRVDKNKAPGGLDAHHRDAQAADQASSGGVDDLRDVLAQRQERGQQSAEGSP